MRISPCHVVPPIRVAFIGVLVLFCLAPVLPGATSLRFEGGSSVQLIDLRGELLEWPIRREIQWTGAGLPALTNTDFAEPYVTHVAFDQLTPEPIEAVALWPVIRPPQVRAWIKADSALALADSGELYEIRTAGRLFGREEVHSVPPAPIASPPGLVAWTDFAGGNRLRLAIGTEGDLWAWESHSRHHPAYMASSSPTNWNVVAGTFGNSVEAPILVQPDLQMHRVTSPGQEVFFVRCKFSTVPPTILPSSGGFNQPYVEAIMALCSDGEIYQYGGYRQYFADYPLPIPPGIGPGIGFIPTNTPVKLVRPASVTGWKDFWFSGRQVAAISEAGELYTWGHNTFGQLGNDSQLTPPEPVPVTKPPGVGTWRKVIPTASAMHGLADNGRLYGWGELSPYRNRLSGDPDVQSDRSQYSFIMTRPAPLEFGTPADPVVDFALNGGTLVVLQASGKFEVHTDYSAGSSLTFMEQPSVHSDQLPPGVVSPAIDRPPFVRLDSPQLVARWRRTTDLTIVAEAVDLDGAVESVTLLANDNELGPMILDQGFYRFDWSRIPRGRYELKVRATDNGGLATDSIPVALYVERPLPTIADPAANPDGTFSLRVVGHEWAPTRVEWSDDLDEWQILQPVVPGSTDDAPVLTDQTVTGKRYYRVVVDEP